MAKPTPPAGLGLVTLLVQSYDPAIHFFTTKLGFTLEEDTPAKTNAGDSKRWVVVRPPGDAGCSVLLAQAEGAEQQAAVGRQFGGRVGLFLRVADFDAAYGRMRTEGVVFIEEPRSEAYGRVVVFEDVCGNRWDLLGPPQERSGA